ncbi:helix-turn-helix domain-containing protein [Streptomyces sp. NPDC023838]|uniref:helix-turn-helix domain-containing protein n=1 Tax=Streptomyces sp. NPDC023838 TaxID=3154325 RepID=UPI0033EEA460
MVAGPGEIVDAGPGLFSGFPHGLFGFGEAIPGAGVEEQGGGGVARRSTKAADAGRRYRLHPTPLQTDALRRWGHTCRAVWNLALGLGSTFTSSGATACGPTNSAGT